MLMLWLRKNPLFALFNPHELATKARQIFQLAIYLGFLLFRHRSFGIMQRYLFASGIIYY